MARATEGTEREPLPADLAVVAARVEARVTDLLDGETARWQAEDPALVEPLDALRALVMAGGKRLRPVFCHWGHVAAGGDPADAAVVDAGAAFELLQAFALIHDDVMDGSATRRGGPAVHHRFATAHTERGLGGEDRRFGEGVAILVGDLALVYADLLLPMGSPKVAALWHELRIELNIGQFLDLAGTATGDVDRVGARRIARLKSGRYTIERPLQLGAHLAGDPTMAEALRGYGAPLGEAFQLRDDVLGVFGRPERTGKPVGDDLREGKPTLMLAAARERADGTGRDLLARVGDPHLAPEVVADLQALFVSTGALDEAEAEIAALAGRAVAALSGIDLPDHADLALRDLADFVVARDA
ncbi:MAG: polyprenyl synthetase family protein [Acidimicrobiales bacterium]|nr:polyprenyl synthetase family protein [Acidimicrobiales bacterium]